MSWSYCLSGPALEVVGSIKSRSEQVNVYLTNDVEKQIHNRIVGIIDVFCHEGREHDVSVDAGGHFDGKHNHAHLRIHGINKVVKEPEPEPEPAAVEPLPEPELEPEPVTPIEVPQQAPKTKRRKTTV